ncbi:MAG: PTS sugar transporter subunit IIA, partial [Erysipelotrichaceae bacterium]|nr:PTS sugar transporter subunit IIA [Erysipelotrichaceae bacterium]
LIDDLTIDIVGRCITTLEDEWRFKFTEESFNSMRIYGVLAILRHQKHLLSLQENEKETVYKYNEYNWAKSLFEMFHKELGVDLSDDEVVFFAIQLLCSGLMHDSGYEENNAYKYDEKMKEFIRVVISSISDVLNIDLDNDEELYKGLLNHIRPAIFRMKFEKHNTKDLTNFVKEEYKETYRVSWILSMLFEEYYGINISSTELSYITLYIQSALERAYKPAKIVLVTELGMGLNQMFCNKIRMAIPKVDKILIVSLRDFDISLLNDYDLIITTSNINIDDDRIIQISSLLNEEGLSLIKQSIRNLNNRKISKKPRFDVSCHSFFDPSLIFTHVKMTDKTQIIEMLTNKMLEKGYVKEKFLASVLKREKAVSTCLGNGVAIPHGNSNYVNDSKVAIAFLDQPISWDSDDEQISAIFLLGFQIDNPKSSKQVQLFYKVFLKLIETDENVERLKTLSREELYKELVS